MYCQLTCTPDRESGEDVLAELTVPADKDLGARLELLRHGRDSFRRLRIGLYVIGIEFDGRHDRVDSADDTILA